MINESFPSTEYTPIESVLDVLLVECNELVLNLPFIHIIQIKDCSVLHNCLLGLVLVRQFGDQIDFKTLNCHN